MTPVKLTLETLPPKDGKVVVLIGEDNGLILAWWRPGLLAPEWAECDRLDDGMAYTDRQLCENFVAWCRPVAPGNRARDRLDSLSATLREMSERVVWESVDFPRIDRELVEKAEAIEAELHFGERPKPTEDKNAWAREFCKRHLTPEQFEAIDWAASKVDLWPHWTELADARLEARQELEQAIAQGDVARASEALRVWAELETMRS